MIQFRRLMWFVYFPLTVILLAMAAWLLDATWQLSLAERRSAAWLQVRERADAIDALLADVRQRSEHLRHQLETQLMADADNRDIMLQIAQIEDDAFHSFWICRFADEKAPVVRGSLPALPARIATFCRAASAEGVAWVREPGSTRLFLVTPLPTLDGILVVSLLSDPLRELLESTDERLWLLDGGGEPIWKEAVDGVTEPASLDGVATVTDLEGRPQWLGLATLGSSGWRLGIQLDRQARMAGARRRLIAQGAGGLCVILLVPIAGWWSWRRLTRPWTRLGKVVVAANAQARPHDEERLIGAVQTMTHDYMLCQSRLTSLLDKLIGFVLQTGPDPLSEDPPLAVSRGSVEATGYGDADFLSGRIHLRKLTHPIDFPRLSGAVAKGVKQGSGWDVAYRIRAADGQLRWLRERGGQLVGAAGYELLLSDITEARTAEAQLKYREELESVIAATSASLIHARLDDVDVAVHEALKTIGVFMKVDHSFVGAFDVDGSFSILDAWHVPGVPRKLTEWQRLKPEATPYMRSMLGGGAFLHIPRVEHATEDAAADMQLWQEAGLQAIVAVPMSSGDQLVGAVGLAMVSSARVWSADVLTLMRIMAEMINSVLARKNADDALRLSEARFRELAEKTSDLIWEIDAEGIYTFVSPKARELLGYEPEEVIGQRISEVRLTAEGVNFQETLDRLMEEPGAFTNLEFTSRRKDGQMVMVESSGVAIHDEAGHFCGYRGIDRDITHRKQAEQALRFRQEFESLVASISSRFINLQYEQMDGVLAEALEAIGAFTRDDHTFILQFSPDHATFSMTHEWCAGQVLPCRDRYQEIACEAGRCGSNLLLKGQVVKLPDREQLPQEALDERRAWAEEQTRSMLILPLVAARRVIGAIGFRTCFAEREWSDDAIKLLKIVGETVANALERKQADAVLQLTRERFDLVTRVAAVYDWNFGTETYTWKGLEHVLDATPQGDMVEWHLQQIHDDDRERVMAERETLLSGKGRHWDVEYRLARADGTWAYVHDEGQVIREGNRVIRMVGVVVDVSQLRAAVEAKERSEREGRIKDQLARLSQLTQDVQSLEELLESMISEMARLAGAAQGAFYNLEAGDPPCLRLLGGYACKRHAANTVFGIGEGLIGQCAQEQRVLDFEQVPPGFATIRSGLGSVEPSALLILPVHFEGEIMGVVELASMTPFSVEQRELLTQVTEILGAVMNRIKGRQRTERLLAESQRLTLELEAQQRELQEANDALNRQTRRLQQNEEELKAQQEELAASNRELQEKTDFLESQAAEIMRANEELALARNDLARKAEELQQASQYKSEFLANMSHELRTPLNSLLLLAGGLADNEDGNLTEDQIEAAGVIQSSGTDLLDMINELLDLAKIEAGKMPVYIESTDVQELAESADRQFRHMTKNKNLELVVEVRPGVPIALHTDRKRVAQVIKNLVSNAIKFTEQGTITVSFAAPGPEVVLKSAHLRPHQVIAIAVSDTGCGISPDKQACIFEAFQQADGSTSRKYGGTGLGLSISREIASLLGGEIHLKSEPGAGSTFTLFLPVQSKQNADAAPTPVEPVAPSLQVAVPPATRCEEPTLLIIEDDTKFSDVLQGFCRRHGFACRTADNGTAGLELARSLLPQGIICDLNLPGTDGWEVLKELKADPATAAIPIHMISVDEEVEHALELGAFGFLIKPVRKPDLDAAIERIRLHRQIAIDSILLVEDNVVQRKALCHLLDKQHVRVVEAGTAQEALTALRSESFACIILDLGLPDMNGIELLGLMREEFGERLGAVIIYTARDLTPAETHALYEHTEAVIIKDSKSAERLLEELDIFLHQTCQVQEEPPALPVAPAPAPAARSASYEVLKGHSLLAVDDDMRNLFALARILRQAGMNVLKAESGEKALRLFEEEPAIELVLMDIMMPNMDGYETMRRMRQLPRGADMPIIALTAKAMPADRQKCLDAGATDYLAKPIDAQLLLAMLADHLDTTVAAP